MEAGIHIPMMQIFPYHNLLFGITKSPDTDVCVFVLVCFTPFMLLTKIIFLNLLYFNEFKGQSSSFPYANPINSRGLILTGTNRVDAPFTLKPHQKTK